MGIGTGKNLEVSPSPGNELSVKAVSSLKAEWRAHILGSRLSGPPDTETECVSPAGLWVVRSYAPLDCSEVVAEVVGPIGPVSSKLEEDSR